jgi:hypothetical protein
MACSIDRTSRKLEQGIASFVPVGIVSYFHKVCAVRPELRSSLGNVKGDARKKGRDRGGS